MKGKYSYLLEHTDYREIMELSKGTSRPITTPRQISNILSGKTKHIELLDVVHLKVAERKGLYEKVSQQ